MLTCVCEITDMCVYFAVRCYAVYRVIRIAVWNEAILRKKFKYSKKEFFFLNREQNPSWSKAQVSLVYQHPEDYTIHPEGQKKRESSATHSSVAAY